MELARVAVGAALAFFVSGRGGGVWGLRWAWWLILGLWGREGGAVGSWRGGRKKGRERGGNGQMWGEAWENEGVERGGRVFLGAFWGGFRGVSLLIGRMVRGGKRVQLHGGRVAALGGWLHGV